MGETREAKHGPCHSVEVYLPALMRPFLRSRRAPLAFALATLSLVVFACGGGSDAGPSGTDADGGAGADGGRSRRGGGDDGSGGGTEEDASSEKTEEATVCSVTRAFILRCAEPKDLTCGEKGFDAWCAQNDANNSEAFRRAEIACLPSVECTGIARKDCEYQLYAKDTPTTAQKKLVQAYCETCEPSDVGGCTERSTSYDSAKGPSTVPDVFIAAWELSDGLVDLIRTSCTGDALTSTIDGGAVDPAKCEQAFGSCAAGAYIDALPNCP